jgi:hypothetical protein
MQTAQQDAFGRSHDLPAVVARIARALRLIRRSIYARFTGPDVEQHAIAAARTGADSFVPVPLNMRDSMAELAGLQECTLFKRCHISIHWAL